MRTSFFFGFYNLSYPLAQTTERRKDILKDMREQKRTKKRGNKEIQKTHEKQTERMQAAPIGMVIHSREMYGMSSLPMDKLSTYNFVEKI